MISASKNRDANYSYFSELAKSEIRLFDLDKLEKLFVIPAERREGI